MRNFFCIETFEYSLFTFKEKLHSKTYFPPANLYSKGQANPLYSSNTTKKFTINNKILPSNLKKNPIKGTEKR